MLLIALMSYLFNANNGKVIYSHNELKNIKFEKCLKQCNKMIYFILLEKQFLRYLHLKFLYEYAANIYIPDVRFKVLNRTSKFSSELQRKLFFLYIILPNIFRFYLLTYVYVCQYIQPQINGPWHMNYYECLSNCWK